MGNVTEKLLNDFKEKGYRKSFENDNLISFEVPIWIDEDVIFPKYEIYVLQISLYKGRVETIFFNKQTSLPGFIDGDILPLAEEVAVEKGWKENGNKEKD